MVPDSKQKGLDYSVIKEKAGDKEYKGLCSSVIYGPNASGKTNMIGAMDTFKSIVLRGHIRNAVHNADGMNGPNAAAGALELIPNSSDLAGHPIAFSIRFITGGLLIEYAFSADIGRFLDAGHPRKILSETLRINNILIFDRREELQFGSLGKIQDFLVNTFEQNAKSAKELAISNLNDEELFLMNRFKTMFSSRLAALITDWISMKFMVIYRADSMRLIQKEEDAPKNSVYIEKTLNKAASCFGVNSNALGYFTGDDGGKTRLCSLSQTEKENMAIPAELFESYGTIRFVNLFPLIMNAMLNGGTLIVDEFDASIHPMALMNIINIFHNDEINIHHAQIIFNTHNPIFLNSNLYRRDEIKFVERDDDSQNSTHYSLSNFGTSGKAGTRKGSDYMKYYFMDRYGAIKDVDFTSVFEEMLFLKKEGSEDA